MIAGKMKLLSAVVSAVALIATPALASKVKKGKESGFNAYASSQQPHGANTVIGSDGKILGADPDPNIRFQLMREENFGGP